MRCLSIAIAFMLVGCSSSDPAPQSQPDAGGGTPEASPGTDAGENTDTQYSLAVVADSPLLYWRFDEKTGQTTARDRTTNKLEGTYSATGIEFGSNSMVGDSNASVRVSPGGSIDGPVDAKLAFTGTASFTIECWVSFLAPPTEIETIVSRAHEGKGSGYSMWLDPAGSGVRAYFGRFEAGTGASVASSEAAPLMVGTTYHLVGVYDGAKLTLYVDGASTEAASTTAITDGAFRLRVGHSEDTESKLNARVDELAIYGTALSKARIDAHRDIAKN